jgi:RNA polymerase sigma factor (sigma-70 family)
MPDYEKYLKDKAKVQALSSEAPLEFKFMYVEPFLDREQEYHLFRKYNFLKYKFKKLVETSGNTRGIIRKNRIISGMNLLRQIKELKQVLTCSQGRLVMNLAKRNKSLELEKACSDGYSGLVLAVDYFDYRKRIRFSTYAWWVVTDTIRKNRIEEVEAFNFLATNNDEEFMQDLHKPYQSDESYSDLREAVKVVLKFAKPKERKVLKYYYGIGVEPNIRPLTYLQIGELLKVSKERIRQILRNGIARIKSRTSDRLLYG